MKQWQAYAILTMLSNIEGRQLMEKPSPSWLNIVALLSVTFLGLVWGTLAFYHFFKKTK